MKRGKRFVSLVLALIMACGLMVNASAAEAQEIKAQLSYDITVNYNGEAQTLTDAVGNIVYPISYNGTTYLPVRAVSYVLGIAVDWDGATQTVLLSDGETAAPEAIPAADAPSGSKDITAQLSPGITVRYNGEAQTMTDAAGNTVYPVSYEGTTYLPVRAVSNMLGVEVDWDGTTQTVLLRTPVLNDDKNQTTIEVPADPYTGTADPDAIRKALEAAGIEASAINDMIEMASNPRKYFIDHFKTSADAQILGEKRIGYDYAEIDWSTANDGYIRAKWTKKLTVNAVCTVRGYDGSTTWYLPFDKWVTIPLTLGSADYCVSVSNLYGDDVEEMTEEEADAIYRDDLNVRFKADGLALDAVEQYLMSNPHVDFENAPQTRAKALEITKNCKTDAEKIAAVFEYVAKTIQYDHEKEKEIQAHTIAANTGTGYMNIGELQNHVPLDDTLTSKTGVCQEYAELMAGMLRSLGIPCKVCRGEAYTGEIIKNYSDDGWEPHAWVAVSPDVKGLNKSTLGVGTESDGWLRLDPTWGRTASGREKAAVDKNHKVTNCY